MKTTYHHRSAMVMITTMSTAAIGPPTAAPIAAELLANRFCMYGKKYLGGLLDYLNSRVQEVFQMSLTIFSCELFN